MNILYENTFYIKKLIWKNITMKLIWENINMKIHIHFCGNATSGLLEINDSSISLYNSIAIFMGIPIDK